MNVVIKWHEDMWQEIKDAALFTIHKTKGKYPDEAWKKKSIGELQKNGNVVYYADMGRQIGTEGEKLIKIVTKGYSTEIVTAFPVSGR